MHGLSTLGLGVVLKRYHGCKLIYDTHELETEAFAVRGVRRLYSKRLERSLIHRCDAVVCVSESIADWYVSNYGIERPLTVRNVPERREQPPGAAEDLRVRFGLPPNSLLFLYQGRISQGRQIERLLKVFSQMPGDRHIIFMGHGPLEENVHVSSSRCANIHYYPPVAPSEVLGYTAQADIGVVGVENQCLSYYLSLPNKLFECLSVGLPVIAPDFPEIAREVNTYNCGWLCGDDETELREMILHISPAEIQQKRKQAWLRGKELSWENEEKELIGLYQRLLAGSRTRVTAREKGASTPGVAAKGYPNAYPFH